MNVFLTGATGYVGRVVAERLQTAGHQVIGLARTPEKARSLWDQGYAVFPGVLSDTSGLAKAASQADAVIHLAAARTPEAAEWDRRAVAAMLQALAGSHRPFLYTSGISVYGDTGSETADEQWPVRPSWRTAVEQQVLSAVYQGVHGLVVRPGLVYGCNGGVLEQLVTHAQQTGITGYPGTGRQVWSLVHVHDLADLYVRMLENGAAGTTLNGVATQMSLLEIAAGVQQMVGNEQVNVQNWSLAEAQAVLGPIAAALLLNARVSGQQAVRSLDWNPQSPAFGQAIATQLAAAS